ncbi:protein translocase subunit SecF, partial [Candidatus Falkowbacteria bacterium]|nr:protein translocase subunit SecF [Candidatus Falkowbacteria bacterium]
QPVGNQDMILRFQDSTEEKHQAVLSSLDKLAKTKSKDNKVEETRFDSVGPSIGQELKQKSVNAIFFVLLAIVLYISWAFRKVSKPIASWKYGMAALIALSHDTIITLGVFSVLGKFYNVEINTPFVAAILTVIGYSVHDTIVVFDRIRENLPKSHSDFEGTVNVSLNQTLVRSVNTSVTVLLTLVAVTVFGGESIRTFALALTVGIAIGTYSSIFVASPILVVWEKWRQKA